MLKDNILFVRRQSGGGCVYHDLGNLNVSFISHKSIYDKNLNNIFLKNILNIKNMFISQRSDLRIKTEQGDLKFSGSAFKEKRDRAIHHLTLLFDTDLEKLNLYIKARDLNLVSRSTASNPAVVTNISQLIEEQMFLSQVKDHKRVESYSEILEIEMFQQLKLSKQIHFLDKMKSHQWIFDETPKFVYEHEYFKMEYKKGELVSLELSDHFHASLNESIQEGLSKPIKFTSILEFLESFNGIDIYKEFEVMKTDLAHFLQVYLFEVDVSNK